MTETQRRIRAYKKALPELRERVIAVALLLAMSASMLASASFAWITLSTAPEVSGMATTVAANGNLEIALAHGLTKDPAVKPEESEVGDASSKKGIVDSNITWGNLVNLSDISYGLSAIALRPALMTDFNREETPLKSAAYGIDGRVVGTDLELGYTSYGEVEKDSGVYQFYASADRVNYGVRAISSIGYGTSSGNAANDPMKQLANSFMKTADSHYTNAHNHYAALVSDNMDGTASDKPHALELKKGTGMYCVNTLEGLVTIFAQDKINEKLGGGSEKGSDCSKYVPYVLYMMEELLVVLEHEGDALMTMANWQAYASGKSQSTKTYATADALRSATDAELKNNGITLTTLKDHKTNRTNLTDAIDVLIPLAEEAENGGEVFWDDLAPALTKMVDINSTLVGGTPLGSIGISNAGAVMNAKTVEVQKGVLKDIDTRVITAKCRLYAKVSVDTSIIDIKNVIVHTSGLTATPTYLTDFNYTRGLVAQDKGDGRAEDTYGMALDLWVRTNHPDAVLTLEGSVIYGGDQPVTTTIGGNTYDIYVITVAEEEKEVFQNDDTWYYVETLEPVAEADLVKAPDQKFEQVPIGYQGENRIWEDWKSMLEDGLIAKDTTTQGAGSCFVFYADPADQVKILDMLRSLTVKFVDKDYNDLGEAKLNIEHATENQGKVTIPLEMLTGFGESYIDENGVDKTGITRLVQNEPTLITAIVYLNGSQLMNENVLAAGELNGQLNIQFGTNAVLVAPNDEVLQKQYRTITAKAKIGGVETTNDVVELDYKAEGHNVVVTLTVDGEQPQSISGYFVRTINSSQGTRCEEIKFTQNEDGTWTGQFTKDEDGDWTKPFVLTNPGNYVLNSLTVDGIPYTLHDGTDEEHEANQPKAFIKGLALSGATAKIDGLPVSGLYMTSNRSVPVTVEAEIGAEIPVNSVSAKIVNKDKTKQYSALLTYDKNNGSWTGTANINSSDTYYLSLITVDGTTLDVPAQNEFTLKVGLSARVKTTVPVDNRDWTYEGEPVQLPMQVELVDGNGKDLIKNLEHVYLKYDGIDNPAGMTWNATKSQYEGVLAPLDPGIFSYEVITLGENGEMGRLYIDSVIGDAPPVFSCMAKAAPTYESDMTEAKQTVIQSGTEAYIHIVTDNAEAASVWADVVTPSGNTVKLTGTHVQNFQDQIKFTLRNSGGNKEDGVWTMKTLYFQNVYDPVKDKKYTLGGEDYYTLDVSDQNITAEVIATANVTVFYGEDEMTEDLVDKNEVAFGSTETTFMTEHKTQPLTITVTDYAGNPVEGLKNVTWTISHEQNTMEDYGGYRGDAGYGTNNLTLTSNADQTTWTASAQSLAIAGEYTATVKTFFDWDNDDVKDSGEEVARWTVEYTVTSKKPTVTISAISPSGAVPTKITWKMEDENGCSSDAPYFSTTDNKTGSRTDYTATVYAQAKADNSTRHNGTFTLPSLTLKVAGVASTTDVSLTLPAGDEGANEVQFTRTGDGTITKSLGRQEENIKTWSYLIVSNHYLHGYVGHGDGPDGKGVAINTMTLKHGGKTFVVTLDNPLKVINPSSVNQLK